MPPRRYPAPRIYWGIWIRWTSVRKVKEGETTNDLFFAVLTTEPNAIVEPIHGKAMPMTLTMPGEIDLWMTAPAKEALRLHRPLDDDGLKIVARGERRDGASAMARCDRWAASQFPRPSECA
jgi:putative SOS response-associated peptidase YedK